MILFLLLQSFETTRLDVPVVGRPTIGGFHETRVDVPVIGRPSTGSTFPRGWSLTVYRSRLTSSVPLRMDRRTFASSSGSPSVRVSFLQSGIALTPPALGGSAAATVAAEPPAIVCQTIDLGHGQFVTICQ